jgi:hypothetical protein
MSPRYVFISGNDEIGDEEMLISMQLLFQRSVVPDGLDSNVP